MFERFTDRSRKVMALANQIAQKYNQEKISPELILLGILREKNGIEKQVFSKYNIDINQIKEKIEKEIKSGPDIVTMGRLPATEEAKNVIEYAIQHARENNFVNIDSYSLLAGIIRVKDPVISKVLGEFEFTEEKLNLGLEQLLKNNLPENKTEQAEQNNQKEVLKYWMIPRDKLNVIELLRDIYNFKIERAEGVSQDLKIYSSSKEPIGKFGSLKDTLMYGKVQLTPNVDDLEQLREVVKLKDILDTHEIEYTSTPSLNHAAASARKCYQEYNDIADSLETKVE